MNYINKLLYSGSSYLYFFIILFSIFIYLFEFYLIDNTFNNFWCVEVKNDFNLPILGDIKLPIHCDEGPYFKASTNLDYFLSDQNPYQKRPLWIGLIALVNTCISFIANSFFTEYEIIRISYIFIQLNLLFVISKLLFLILKLDLKNFTHYLPISVLLLFPNIRWNILFPSHENLTIAALLMTLYVMTNNTQAGIKNKYIYLIFGILTLAHRSFLIYGLLIFFYELFPIEKLINSIKKLFYLISPYLFYETLFISFSVDSFDWNKNNYQQFYWIYNRISGKDTINEQEFCQTFATFFKCNISITLNFLSYFMILVIFTSLLFAYNAFYKSGKFGKIKILFYLSSGIYLFWSLQGWYPNYRFINYSLGYLLTLAYILMVSNYEYKKNAGYTSLILYFLSINYLEPYSQIDLNLNHITFFSIIGFTYYFVSILRKKGIKFIGN